MKPKMSEAAKKQKAEYNKRYRRNMTPEQKQKQAKYKKEWGQRNPEKVMKHWIDFWERKAIAAELQSIFDQSQN